MKNMKLKAGIGMLMILLVLPIAVSAFGVGLAPQSIDFGELVKGSTSTKQIYVGNPGSDVEVISLNAGGECGDWISLDSDEISLNSGKEKKIPVRIDIPDTVANDDYSCSITASIKSVGISRTGMVIQLSSTTGVHVSVTGLERVDGNIKSFTVDTAKDIASFTLSIENRGTVRTSPQSASVKIENKMGEDIDEVKISSIPEANPGEVSQVTLAWDASKASPGSYVATANVVMSDELTITGVRKFMIFGEEKISLADESEESPEKVIIIREGMSPNYLLVIAALFGFVVIFVVVFVKKNQNTVQSRRDTREPQNPYNFMYFLVNQ